MPAHSERAPAVIFDASAPTSLVVLRSLGPQGVPTIGVFAGFPRQSRFRSVVEVSRFLTCKASFPPHSGGETLVQKLLELGRDQPTRPVVFPTGDNEVMLVSKYRQELEPFYRFDLPDHDILRKLVHKSLFYRMAQQLRIPIASTFFPGKTESIEGISQQVRYPCILKPAVRNAGWAQVLGSEKVLFCTNPSRLQTGYRSLPPDFRDCVVQEVIEGAESNILCSFTYLDHRGNPLGMSMCRKLRQQPPHFGNTVLAISIWDNEIERLTLEICETLDLRGYVSIEFKWSEADNRFLVIEVTSGRLDRQVGITLSQGPGIPSIWYNHLTRRPTRNNGSRQSGIKWLSESQDMHSTPSYLKSRELSLSDWIRSYRGLRYCEVLSYCDPRPFLQFLLSGMSFIRGELSKHLSHRRRRRRTSSA